MSLSSGHLTRSCNDLPHKSTIKMWTIFITPYISYVSYRMFTFMFVVVIVVRRHLKSFVTNLRNLNFILRSQISTKSDLDTLKQIYGGGDCFPYKVYFSKYFALHRGDSASLLDLKLALYLSSRCKCWQNIISFSLWLFINLLISFDVIKSTYSFDCYIVNLT